VTDQRVQGTRRWLTGVDRSSAPTSTPERKYVLSYVLLRIIVGVVGLLLPLVLILGDAAVLDAPFSARDSLSAYYHSPMRDFFVGTLCVIGILLVTYMLADWRKAEFWASTIGGICLLGVAGCPTERSNLPPGAPYCEHLDPLPNGCTELEHRYGEVFIGHVHLGFAAVALASLGFIALIFALRERTERQSRWLAALHFACAGVIALALALAVVGTQQGWRIGALTPMYVGEVATVAAFGVGWIAKGIDLGLWLREHPAPA
jgi:hypothetical protein